MTKGIRKFARFLAARMRPFGFDPNVMLSWRHYPLYRQHRRAWLQQGGLISKTHMVLSDYTDSAGTTKGHYFHQDLLVASFIAAAKPARHVDIGSRIDGFVAHVASFREIEVVDIRPLPAAHANIRFLQADIMQQNDIGKTDSLSCLHAIEHFGLGRYTDPIDVDGHIKALKNLVALIEPGGRLYISFPIGKEDQVHFNAHRVFHPESILAFPGIDRMELERFDYVDDEGQLHRDTTPQAITGKVEFGCGIYTFTRKTGS